MSPTSRVVRTNRPRQPGQTTQGACSRERGCGSSRGATKRPTTRRFRSGSASSAATGGRMRLRTSPRVIMALNRRARARSPQVDEPLLTPVSTPTLRHHRLFRIDADDETYEAYEVRRDGRVIVDSDSGHLPDLVRFTSAENGASWTSAGPWTAGTLSGSADSAGTVRGQGLGSGSRRREIRRSSSCTAWGARRSNIAVPPCGTTAASRSSAPCAEPGASTSRPGSRDERRHLALAPSGGCAQSPRRVPRSRVEDQIQFGEVGRI